MNLTPIEAAGSSRGGAQGTSSSSSSSSSGGGVAHIPAPPVPRVDPLYLQQLSDMGFTREHAEEALLACGNELPSAMEWILSHPPSSEVSGISNKGGGTHLHVMWQCFFLGGGGRFSSVYM